MARSSLESLIERIYKLIGDKPGATQVFDADDIEEALDKQRDDVRYMPLTEVETYSPGGAGAYLDYYAPVGNWEAGVILVDGQYNVLTPVTSDLLLGHWTFSADTQPPVYAVGKTYDIYRAAADLLDQWAAKLKLEYNFSSESRTYNREGRLKALADLATRYRMKARPRVIHIERSDVNVCG